MNPSTECYDFLRVIFAEIKVCPETMAEKNNCHIAYIL